jgi:hypothetical protein
MRHYRRSDGCAAQLTAVLTPVKMDSKAPTHRKGDFSLEGIGECLQVVNQPGNASPSDAAGKGS